MTVSNSELANEDTFNGAFLSKDEGGSTVGIIQLNNSDAVSGDAVTNLQREANSLASFAGKSLNSVKNDIPNWTDNQVGASTDSLFTRTNILSASMNKTTGHKHDNSDGSGGPISASDLAEFNQYFGMVQRLTYSDVTDVTGTSFDFSGVFNTALKQPTGSYSTIGVFSTGSFRQNVVRIRYKDRPVTDSGGFEIYGRFDVTGSGPYTWNIDFFINNPDNIGEEPADIGTLDAASFGVDLYFMEIFNAESRITVPEDLTSLIPFGGTGGAGGGSSFAGIYVEPGTSTPAEDYSSIAKRFSFDPAADQDVRVVCVVPDSYSPGSQIFLEFLWGANAVSGGVRWAATIELYRQASSTFSVPEDFDNTAVTETLSGSADLIRKTTLELTDASGQVGAIPVAQGDLIVVYLKRFATNVADTATVAANMIASSVKVGV